MDRYEYKELKESGGLVTDAALQEEPKEIEITEVEEEQPEQTEPEVTGEDETPTEEPEPTQEIEEEDDLPELSEKEKTAFEKRMEREKRKMEEQYKQEYEAKFGKHKAVIDMLGGDPEALEKRIREGQMAREAEAMAEQNGWTDQEKQWYIQQQQKDQRLKELEVQVQINELKDQPEYEGIQTMKETIISKIQSSNGALSVQEAFWAVGGPKRIEQIKLEATVREQERRKKQPRTVLTDSPAPNNAEKPLPSDVLKDAERMGISPAEARRLMNSEPAGSIDEYRRRKAK